jgi:hypothetical protein
VAADAAAPLNVDGGHDVWTLVPAAKCAIAAAMFDSRGLKSEKSILLACASTTLKARVAFPNRVESSFSHNGSNVLPPKVLSFE